MLEEDQLQAGSFQELLHNPWAVKYKHEHRTRHDTDTVIQQFLKNTDMSRHDNKDVSLNLTMHIFVSSSSSLNPNKLSQLYESYVSFSSIQSSHNNMYITLI